MNELSEDLEYYSIDQVSQVLEQNKATTWQWIRTLGLKTYRFKLSRKSFIAGSDMKRLKEFKDKPWMMKEKKASNGITPR